MLWKWKKSTQIFFTRNKVEFTNGAYLDVKDVCASEWFVTECGRVISFGERGSRCTELVKY